MHLAQLLTFPVLLAKCLGTLLIKSLSLVSKHDVLLIHALDFLTSCRQFELLALHLFTAALSFGR